MRVDSPPKQKVHKCDDILREAKKKKRGGGLPEGGYE